MHKRNQLFFIVFIFAYLSGCGTLAPVQDTVTGRGGAGPAQVSTAPHVNSPRTPIGPGFDSELLLQAIAAAGTGYRAGGSSHQSGFDCSGLVAFVFREAYGIDLPHNSRAQSDLGEPVGIAELRPGDLVFFNTQRTPFSHVGIFVGEGKFIHAPREGSAVRTERLAARYWKTRYDGARRMAPLLAAARPAGSPSAPALTYP